MKLLFDQNLSPRLVGIFASEFPRSEHVLDVGLDDADDSYLWSYAAVNGYVIVSKDIDFQQRALVFRHPPKVLWVRLGNCPTATVAALLKSRLREIQAFETDPAASFLALS